MGGVVYLSSLRHPLDVIQDVVTSQTVGTPPHVRNIKPLALTPPPNLNGTLCLLKRIRD